MNNITFKQYRAIDLGIMALLLVIFESITTVAATKWFPGELYTFSLTIAVVCIVMMRWNGFAAIHAAAGGLAFCVVSGANLRQFAVYCIGNCFILVALVFIKAVGKSKIMGKFYYTIIYTVIAFTGAQTGRWLVSVILGAPFDSLIDFLTMDSLSLLFAVVVVLISRRVDGLFEDQRDYLVRTESERKRHSTSEF